MKQAYLLIIAVVVVLTGAFFTYQLPKLEQTAQSIKIQDKKIKETNDKLVSARVLTQELEEVSKVIKNSVAGEFIVRPEEKNIFIKQIADLADLYKIPITKVIPRLFEKESSSKLSQKYNVGIHCTYVQLGQFMSALESLDYLMQITELNVTPMANKKTDEVDEIKETRYQVNLQVNAIKLIKES